MTWFGFPFAHTDEVPEQKDGDWVRSNDNLEVYTELNV